MKRKRRSTSWHFVWPRLKLPWSGWLRRPGVRLVGITLTASLAVLALVVLKNPFHQVEAGWWNGGWQYRQTITITNNESSDLTDYQVSVTLDTATLITAGKLQADCDDLRFINQGGQELPFWIEENSPGCNNAATKIWVKVPNIPADNGTMAVYYGNASAEKSPKHNGAEVFNFFDDFNSGSDFDDTKWSACTGDFSTAISGGELTATRDAVDSDSKLIADTAPNGDNYVMRARAKATTFAASGDRFGVSIKANASDSCRGYNYVQGQELTTHAFLDDRVAWDASVYNEGVAASTYRTTEIYHNGTNVYGRVNDGTWRSIAWSGRTGYPALNVGAQADVSVTVWDWALVRKITANEPTTAFASEETTPDPVAEWKFDEGQGQTVHDSTKQGNNGTLGANSGSSTDDPAWVAEDQCVSGKCLQFDGSADHVSTSIATTQYSGYTYTAWFNMTLAPTTENQVIFARKDGSAEQGNAAAFVRGTTGQLVCGHRTTTGWVETGANFSAYDTWNQVTCVWDGTTVYAYLNGKLLGSIAAANFDPPDNEMRIGADFPFNDRYFPGFIDEIKVYPYARTAAQIKTDYAAGAAVLGATDQSFLSDGLVGYWKMDESGWSGTSGEVKDASGNGNNGTRVGNATTAGGKFGSGGTFDGSGDYVTVADNSSLDTSGDFSWSVWVYKASSAHGGIFNSGSSSNPVLWFSTNNLTFTEPGVADYTGLTTITENTWTHFTVTKKGTDSNNLLVYKNGELVNTKSVGTTSNSTSTMRIGEYAGHSLNGKIDEMRFYNRALSADEVKALYNWAPGPVLHLKMDEATGQTTYDSSTFNNPATLGASTGTGSDDPTWSNSAQCKYGSCLYFGTDADHTRTLDSTSLDIKHAITVAAWVNPSQLDYDVNSRAYNHIVSKWNAYALRVFDHSVNGNYGFDFTIFDSSSGFQAVGTSISEIPAMNRWYYVTGTYDGTTVKTYVDGVLKYSTAHTGDLDLSANNLFIGSYEGLSTGTRFNGYIDDVKIYNYARTEAQIQQDMLGSGDSIQSSNTLPQPIAHWSFDEQAGQLVHDQVNGLGASLGASDSFISTDDPTWKTKQDCKINGCLSFDGGDFVNITSGSQFSTSTLSVSAWIKPNSGTGQRPIFGGFVTNTASKNYFLLNNSALTWDQWPPSGGSITYASLANGSWYHVVATQDLINNRRALYVNGKQVASDTSVETYASGTPSSWTIGGWPSANYYWDGLIDEVKVYNTALTASQVAQDYAAGSAVVASTTGSSEAADMTDGEGQPPVGYWNFNDSGTPTGLSDTSGTNSSLMTLINTESADWKKGKIGGGVEFDGTNEFAYLSNPISALKPATTLTVETWVKADSLTHGTPSRPYLVALQPPGAWQDGRGYALQIDSNGKARFQLGNASGSWKAVTGATTLTTNTWYHLVGTYDGTTIKVYVNGKLDGSSAQSITISYSTASCGTCRPNPTTLYFGAEHSNSGTGNTDTANMYFFDGLIDDVKIYNYARTPAQIAYDYNRGKPIAHWKMNECQGTTIHDASGNGLNGTLSVTVNGGNTNGVGTCNTATSAWGSGATGKYGASLNFDGNGDYVAFGDHDQFDKDLTNGFTVSAWTKPTSTSNTIRLLSKSFYSGNWSNSSWNLSISSVGFPYFGVFPDGVNITGVTGNTSVQYGQWQMITGVYDGSTLKVYLNGKMVGSENYSSGIYDGTTQLVAGQRGYGDATQFLNGQLDDVQIFNYALSANQVKKLYNESSVLRFGE